MTLPNVDNTTLNDLTPNLDVGDVADPALRLAAFQYIYEELQAIANELNNLPTANIRDLAVTTAKINDLAVTTGKIASLSVTTEKLNDASVTLAKIAANSVGSSQLINSAVTASKIANGILTAEKFVPGALTNDTQNGLRITAVEANDNKQYKRNRSELRRESAYVLEPYSFPTGFNWSDPPIRIFDDGQQFYTNFDVSVFKNAGGTTYYVDGTNGNNSNTGLSEAQAFKTLEKGYVETVSGDTIMILDGTYTRQEGWSLAAFQKSLNLIAKNSGQVNITVSDRLTYSLSPGTNNVYEATRTNVLKVVDISIGESVVYDFVGSISDCENTPGSWYHDGTKIYIHNLTGTSPDNDTLFALLNTEHPRVDSSLQAITFYMDGINIYGGLAGQLFDRNAETLEAFAKNCKFLHSTSNSNNAVNVRGCEKAFFQGCSASYSQRDGFNYTAYNFSEVLKTAPKFIEVNCIGGNNGFNNVTEDNTYNGSTAHTGAIGIRVNGEYYGNVGGNVADVQPGTQSVNLGCVVYDSQSGAEDSTNSDFVAQQAGAEMWLDRCRAFGSTWSIYAATGTTMHVYNSEYDTFQGGGIFDIVNPL